MKWIGNEASCRPYNRLFCCIIAAIILIELVIATPVWGDQAIQYHTNGLGKIQVCKGIGLETCGYQEVQIPALVNTMRREWGGVYHEKKSNFTMCYLQMEQGIWTKKKLMFKCVPTE